MTQQSCSCGAILRVRAESVGKKVKCPKCSQMYLVRVRKGTSEPALVRVAEATTIQPNEPYSAMHTDAFDTLDPLGNLSAFEQGTAASGNSPTYLSGQAAAQQWYQPTASPRAEPVFRPWLFLGIAVGTIAVVGVVIGGIWAARKIGAQLAADQDDAQTQRAPAVAAAPVALPDSNEKLNQLYRLPAGATDSTPLLIDATTGLDRQPFADWLKQRPMGIGESVSCSFPADVEKEIPAARAMTVEYIQSLLSAHAAASQAARARYPTDFSDGNDSLFPEGIRLKNLCKLLLVEACLRAAEGKLDDCVTSLVTAIKCSQSLMGYPTVVADAVRIHNVINTQNCMLQLVSRYEFSDEQLDKLREELRVVRESDQSTYCMSGSLGLTLISLRANKLDSLVDENDGTPQELERIRQTLRNPTERDREYLVGNARELVAACKLPYPERLDKFDAIGKELDKTLALPSQERPHAGVMATLSHLKYAQAVARLDAITDISQVILAIEKYRRARGRIPDRLAELVPTYVDPIPVDSFDGEPLRYVPGDTVYTLYSVGENRKDDGGQDDGRHTLDIAYAIPLDPRAPSTQPTARPEDQWVEKLREIGELRDILSDIDLQNRSLKMRGNWSYRSTSPGSMVFESQATDIASYLQVADNLPPNYRLWIDVEILSGQGSFNVALPVRDSVVLLVLDGWEKGISGLNLVNGRSGAGNETTYASRAFKPGEINTIEVSVTGEGIYATVNGKRVINWRGDPSALSMEQMWPQDLHKLWIGSWQTHYKVSRFELVELTTE